MSDHTPNIDPHANLAALADGTLDPERARELEGQVTASPELGELLAEQRRTLAMLQAAEVTAPPALRARVDALIADAQGSRRRRRSARWSLAGTRPRMALGAALATAVVAAVLAVALPGGPGGPTVADAAALASKPATQAAPAENPLDRDVMQRSAAGLAFPYWQDRFDWKAIGARTDTFSGRQASTVFYDRHDARIAYSIVSGGALPAPTGGRTLVYDGVRMTVARQGSRTIVTWLRHGHSCVLSGHGVSVRALEQLASWRGGGRIPY